MELTHLGRTGLEVSRLCLGTMNFGPRTGESEAHVILDRALDHGVQFIDTANAYGRKRGEGITERILGRWLAQGDRRRERVVLATKVYGRMGDGPNESKLSARHIMQACEGSLRRLQTDWIDLYQMHHIDRATPWDEIWQAMDKLIRDGKILYVGSSNFAGWHIAQACEEARRRHLLGLVSEQSLYHLAERSVEREVVPACRSYGLGLLPWSPLAGGALAGPSGTPQEGRRADEWSRARVERWRSQLERYEALCRELGAPPGRVALAWLLTRPGVTAPIIGPRTVEQLDDALAAPELTLDDDTLEELDRIFPGPGVAPEAYAW